MSIWCVALSTGPVQQHYWAVKSTMFLPSMLKKSAKYIWKWLFCNLCTQPLLVSQRSSRCHYNVNVTQLCWSHNFKIAAVIIKILLLPSDPGLKYAFIPVCSGPEYYYWSTILQLLMRLHFLAQLCSRWAFVITICLANGARHQQLPCWHATGYNLHPIFMKVYQNIHFHQLLDKFETGSYEVKQ